MIGLSLILLSLVSPQGGAASLPPAPSGTGAAAETWFTVHPASTARRASRLGSVGANSVAVNPGSTNSAAKGLSELLISARRPQAPAEIALRELARALGWKFVEPSAAVAARLDPVVVDLAFTRQAPRQIADCIATVAGLELEFRAVDGTTQVMLSLPSAGPSRLRERASVWFERGLELKRPRISSVARLQGLLRLGQLRVAQGRLEAAVTVFDRIYEEDDTRRFARQALSAKCRAHLAMASRGGDPELRRRAQLQLAEDAARRLWQLRSPEIHGPAALLLGEVLDRAERPGEGVQVLARDRRDWAATPEADAIRLRLAAFHRQLEEPRQSLAALQPCLRPGVVLTPADRCSLRFERGVALASLWTVGTPETAAASIALLEDFLAMAEPQDPRRSTALLNLGQIYFATGRGLQALAVTRMVLDSSGLERRHLQAARVLRARVQIASGGRATALDELAIATRSNPHAVPEQVLFLAREHHRAGAFDEAARVAGWLDRETTEWGDAARSTRAKAMLAAARRDGQLRTQVPKVRALLPQIRKRAIRDEVAAWLVDAYVELGETAQATAIYGDQER